MTDRYDTEREAKILAEKVGRPDLADLIGDVLCDAIHAGYEDGMTVCRECEAILRADHIANVQRDERADLKQEAT